MPFSKALITVIDGPVYESISQVTLPTFQRYADRHGYDLIVTPRVPDAPSAQWSKPTRLLEALKDHDFAMWVDVDAAIATHAPDLSDRVMGTPAFQSFVWLPYSDGFISTGVWSVRRCEAATTFLQACLKRRKYFNPADGLHDSKAIWYLLDHHPKYRIPTVLLNERWNSRQLDNDPYVYHATGARERADRGRCLNLLRAFIAADTSLPSAPGAKHVTLVFDTEDFLATIEQCASMVVDPSLDRFQAIFELLTSNIPGLVQPELTAQIQERLNRLAATGPG